MTFDGFYTYHMIKELQQVLINGRINKIHHPFSDELVFTIRNNRQNYKLLINISSQYARVQLTHMIFTNPETPTNFCMVLRKHLEGAKIINIQQLGLDRVITITLENTNELGDSISYHLSIELMGKHSNVFLIDPQHNIILECIKHIPFYKNTYRTILPNAQYVLPPQQHKKSPLTLSVNDIKQFIDDTQTLGSQFQGISKQTEQAIFAYQNQHNLSLEQAIYDYVHLPTQPTINERQFSAVASFEGQIFETLSESLDVYFEQQVTYERQIQLTHSIRQKLTAIISRNKTKIERFLHDLKDAENSEDWRIKGDLLMANSHALSRGETEVTLDNFYDDNKPLTINLKTEKNAQQNAKDYFKKYQKIKQSVQYIRTQLNEAIQENDYLENVLVQLDSATPDIINEIKMELSEWGYIKQTTLPKAKKAIKSKPLLFQSADGTKILVGRNNQQNDTLTLKQAKKEYIWLHAKDIPGSHVIIESASPSEDTLSLAANLAAYYSKFKLSSNVPVDYVAVKHVKKPSGAKPGFVIYDNQKTYYATPNENELMTHAIHY